MTDDLVKRLENVRCDGVEELCWEAADRIKALQAERCTEVRPLEWEEHEGNYPKWVCFELVWGGTFHAVIDKSQPLSKGRFPLRINGIWDGKKHQNLRSAKAAAQADYERRILSAITTRPASEVQAEAHAAAVEAAKEKVRKHAVLKVPTTSDFMGDWVIDDLDALHTDASLAYLAAREERIKREALREAAEAAKKKAREYEQTYDNTTEIGTAVHAAITALIEKDKDDD